MLPTLPRKARWNLFFSAIVLTILVLLVHANRGLSREAIVSAVMNFGPTCIALVFTLGLAQIFCTILRTWLLFPREAKVGLLGAAHAISFGQLVNTFFPARAGDVLKAVIARDVSRNGSLTLMAGAGVILADKLIDFGGLVLLILFSGTHLLSRFPIATFKLGLWIVLGVLVLSSLSFLWLYRKRKSKRPEWLNQLKLGFAGLACLPRTAPALVIATASWACEALALKTLCYFQGIPLSFDDVVFLLCLLNVAIAIPISLANLGTFEATLVFGLGTLGVAMAKGLAVATVHHSLQLIGILAWAGSVALVRRVLQIRAVSRTPAINSTPVLPSHSNA